MTRMVARIAVLFCLIGATLRAQEGTAPDVWTIRGDPIAYWAFDPGFIGEAAAADPNRALVEAVLLRTVRNAVPGAPPSPALEAGLRPSVLGASAYRLSLYGISPGNGQRSGIRLEAVLQIFTEDRQVIIEAALREALIAADPNAEFARDEWGEDQVLTRSGSVAWIQQPHAFTILFGEIPPAQAVSMGPAAAPGFAPFRERCAVLHPEGATVFEGFVDFDRLRRAIPEEVGWGPVGELMHAWRMSNARGLMLRARATTPVGGGPSTVHAAIAWAARAEPPVRVRTAAITHATWPQPLGAPPADAGYFAAVALPPQLALSLAVGSYEALARDDRGFEQRKLAWVRNLGLSLDRAARAMPPIIVIVGPGHTIASPSLLIPATHTPETREDVRALLASLQPDVSWNQRARFWSIKSDSIGLPGPFLLAPTASGYAGGWNSDQLPPPPIPQR